jgi:iron-sulfur cluster repair protein YtfE (RIC family)
MTETAERDVIEELTHDHREVQELFAHLDKLPAGDPARRQLADQLTVELVRHSVAEQQHLYPAYRAAVPDDAGLADKEIADHAEAEQLLRTLEPLAADDLDFDTTLAELQDAISAHVTDEENRLFPRLYETLDHARLLELGEKIRAAKQTAPTRPHPDAPDTPPWNKILAPGAGLVDRARDLLTGRKH